MMVVLPYHLMQETLKPIASPPLFAEGQAVRVLKNVTQDGQTPAYWSGARCRVLGRFVGGMLTKQWVYRLQHRNGKTGDFKESELDLRFCRAK